MRRLSFALSVLPLGLLLFANGCGFITQTKTGDCANFFHDSSCEGTTGTGATNYVFVVNNGASTVTGMGISTAGALSALSGSPISVASTAPTAAAVSRNNSFLYIGNASQIFGYAISSTGALTILNSGAALANTAGSTDMQVTPDGKWLMVLDSSGVSVDLFAINTTTGGLTTQTGAAFQLSNTGTVPYHLAINPAGTRVAAAMGLGGQILWSFDTSTGAFTELSRTPAVNSTTADRGLTWDTTGGYLFLTRTGGNQGLVVEGVSNSGVLTPTTSTVYGTGNKPTSVATDNTGKYVYVTNESDSTITGYSIGSNAALTAIAGSPFSAGVGGTAIGMDSTGKWVVVAAVGGSPDLSLYGFDATNAGRLYAVSSTSTGTNASFVALSH